jgi:7,8-dihydropterin-6-yl-methyl-4-(beta-D-ribofuranosyl)aminobenzene 5'-phosphate synthase
MKAHINTFFKLSPFCAFLLLSFFYSTAAYTGTEPSQTREGHRVSSLRILVLSTMLADEGVGEWGYAAIVEADGHRILFDTGARPDTVLKNARELGVDLAGVKDVVLSHNHSDHTGGLMALRRELVKKNRKALSRAHVGRGIFWSRPSDKGENNIMVGVRAKYKASGGSIIEHNEPVEIFPGVWLTGPVPRIHPERNWSTKGRVETPEGSVEDTIPEDISLVVDTPQGLVLISGCGHAGIINTIEYARSKIRQTSIYAAIGGFHLFNADDQKLEWTAAKLREFGLKHFMGGHCTGVETVFNFRRSVGLDRKSCVVSAVGSSFTLDKGIDPLDLAR